MKIISVSSLFPPYAFGGAELSAASQAGWLAAQGHEVFVLGASVAHQPEGSEGWHGVSVVRRNFPRPYPVHEFPNAPQWKKPLWHLQDSLDPRNTEIVGRVLDEIKPDAALVHYVPGIGYNALDAISSREIPTVYYLHDLGLACTRMSMFRGGKDCGSQCLNCRVTSAHRVRRLAHFDRIGFCSPSRANLERLQQLLPIGRYPSIVIPNANHYPAASALPTEFSGELRVLYVGRLHAQKGVEVALEAVAALSASHAIRMRVVGGGPLEAPLRERYEAEPWCSFSGHVSAEEVSNEMVDADVLVVPSVWMENAPGVAIQALGLGLPVIGSSIGGIPELVEDGATGLLVEPGNRLAWIAAIKRLLDEPELLGRWRERARAQSSGYEQGALGRRHLAFMEQVMQTRLHAHDAA
jgi:glycosyltransferase involved in cell wall biosynthesis